jgi:DNA adenine methylase
MDLFTPARSNGVVNIINELPCRPILKWAGGKSQLLGELLPIVPKKYGQYIEPFFGGGALFFALRPKQAIIADSNPEIINLYKMIATNVEGVISCHCIQKF